jgi:hypothetical protein
MVMVIRLCQVCADRCSFNASVLVLLKQRVEEFRHRYQPWRSGGVARFPELVSGSMTRGLTAIMPPQSLVQNTPEFGAFPESLGNVWRYQTSKQRAIQGP